MQPRELRMLSTSAVFWTVLWLSVLGLAVRPPFLYAENGEVLSISEVLPTTDVTDIALDTSADPPGGSFWVLGGHTGKIYHVSRDLSTLLGELDNPHGVGQIPNFILSWGIAYRTVGGGLIGRLFVLAQDSGAWVVKEMNTADGTEVVGSEFQVQTPDATNVSLRGLTFDQVNLGLWFLDVNNEKAFRTDFTGAVIEEFSLPGTEVDGVEIRGEGISFQQEQVSPGVFETRLYVPYGDIFRQSPSRIIQLTTSGVETGIEIPLLDLGDLRPAGIQTHRVGLQQRRVALVTKDGKLVDMEQVIPDPVPPSDLRCKLTLSNQVELDWQNHGSEADNAYGGEILVLRNGVPFATLPGTTTTFVDTTPFQGTSTYALQASEAEDPTLSPESFSCEITVGTGGLVRWIPSGGTSVFDIARNETTGDIFITDPVGTGMNGRILHYDSELNLLGEIPSPHTRPGPIVFLPMIEIQSVILEDVLAVLPVDGLLLRIIGLDGAVKTSYPLGLPDTVDLGGLTYLPASQEYAIQDLESHEIKVLDASGALQRSCKPTDLFGELPPMEAGLTYDPILDAFQATFTDGLVREMYSANCLPTTFEYALSSLGEGFDTAGFFGGIQIAGNTLLVLGKDSNALFQVLLSPFSPDFVRGDFDRDGSVTLTDAVATAQYLFLSGQPPTCQDAADANDDAILDVSDPIYLLFHLFLQGLPPPEPYPDPGSDPTFRDNLGCGD